jgi:glycosyltransferase involved in cell wall biosynthesis
MVSIIIPTLWKSDYIYDTIRDFSHCGLEGMELIIIDNANSDYNFQADNMTIVKQQENIFVNPAWNLGVEMAKNDTICLLNDDISINLETLYANISRFPEYGIIGFDANRNLTQTLNNDDDVWELEEATCRSLGFGCMMIMPKPHYEPIPSDLKIYFGDDMLYWLNKDHFKRKIYNIKNLYATGELSKTSKPYEPILQEEVHHFDRIIPQLQQKYKNGTNGLFVS